MEKSGIYYPVISLFICLLLGVSGIQAVAQQEAGLEFFLDFQTTQDDTQLQSTIENTPVFYEVTVDGETKTRFDLTLVLKNASDLIGVNCDLVFDPTQLQVVDIYEARGDLNFDGRANIADILVLGELFNQSADQEGYSYFNRVATGSSLDIIDYQDVEAVLPYVNESSIFWTSNPNLDFTELRESVEIFETPDVSNARGKIDDIVVVLLSRVHPIPQDFGFDGDARIADITFEIVGDISGGTSIQLEDSMAIHEDTVITPTEITGASVPSFQNIEITHP